MRILVVAKEPRPGRVKTRLCPPLTAEQAASVAAACLADTFAAALASGADEVVAVLDGEPGWWCPPAVRVVPQATGSFAARLDDAWTHARGPAVQIGMDTPQVSAALLDEAMDAVASSPGGGVIGPATDGGWWLLGLRDRVPGAFHGVPMSAPDTAALQRRRLADLGVEVRDAPPLTDIDTFDALRRVVATLARDTHLARLVADELDAVSAPLDVAAS